MSSRLRRGMVRGLAALRGRSHARESSQEERRDPIVSLTFDDGVASQRLAGELLTARGLTGTFYVQSSSVGSKGNLGWDDLRALVAQGHEIGGHTSSHPHLPVLTPSEARREIESDRLALLERSLDPVTFAYPYGESSPEVESIVREVGYIAARGIGGVVESLPPQNPFRLRAPHSPRAWTTSEHLIALTLVGGHEGGWMIIPFHHLEAEGRAASSYTTEPSQFAEFLDWLIKRAVPVVRVRDVIAGVSPS
jgi:peptidoglycan/xylan/chitin deacetylase (PgdA/CDA1 family)